MSTLERQSVSTVLKPDQTDGVPFLLCYSTTSDFMTRRLLPSVQKDVLPASHKSKIFFTNFTASVMLGLLAVHL